MSFVPGQSISASIYRQSATIVAGTANKNFATPAGILTANSLVLVTTGTLTVLGAHYPYVTTVTPGAPGAAGSVIVTYDNTFAGVVTLIIIN